MLPGEVATISAGQVSYERIDRVRPTVGSPGDLRDEIILAVRRRAISSDVPVACLVSGGLDSSITYTLARRYNEITPYHVENGELEQCQSIAPQAQIIPAGNVSLDRGLLYMQEPIDLGSLLPQVALSDAIGREGFHVALTGDGADELLSGYGRSYRYDSQSSDVWHELVAWHLPRLDRVMMRNRVEVRSPFLARRVVELSLGIPWSLRYKKRILREIFRGELPAKIIDAPKHPLKTAQIEQDREAISRRLVNMFYSRSRG